MKRICSNSLKEGAAVVIGETIEKNRNEGVLCMEDAWLNCGWLRVYIRSDTNHRLGTADPSLIAPALRDRCLSGPLVQDLYLL